VISFILGIVRGKVSGGLACNTFSGGVLTHGGAVVFLVVLEEPRPLEMPRCLSTSVFKVLAKAPPFLKRTEETSDVDEERPSSP